MLFCTSFQGCWQNDNGIYQGYVDADIRYMASNFSGILENLYVDRGDAVKKGDVLFALDLLPESASFDEAKAKVDAAQADIDRLNSLVKVTKDKFERRQTLGAGKFSYQEEIDITQNDYQSAQKQLEAAQANLKIDVANLQSAEWSAERKEVYSSVDASVFDVFYRPGEFVESGRPVLSLLAPKDIKILFFVPEKQIGKIQLGQAVVVTCDSCKNPISANVVFISPKSEYTPPVIYSEEAKTKLTFLVEAKADIANSKMLHPGEPVSVSVKLE